MQNFQIILHFIVLNCRGGVELFMRGEGGGWRVEGGRWTLFLKLIFFLNSDKFGLLYFHHQQVNITYKYAGIDASVNQNIPRKAEQCYNLL